ncbi:nuclear transport factor 2 family protein [Kitasatospora sp. NPDC057904]|uniref:nuclear transport factor 2 family protein n=2 Tax=unclassified Kitasatospora TaxID=2633591 RepID=UPI0036D8518A
MHSVNFNEGMTMSASVIQFFYEAMKSQDPAALAASLADDVVITEPSALPYGGTTTSRDEFFQKVPGWLNQFSTWQFVEGEIFGDGERLAGLWSAVFTAHASGETIRYQQFERYEVRGHAISKVDVYQSDTQGLIDFFKKNGPAW